MTDGIQQSLTKRSFWHKISLNTLDSFIGYPCPHILQINQFDCLIYLLQKRTVYFILIKKVCICLKKISFLSCSVSFENCLESPQIIPSDRSTFRAAKKPLRLGGHY